MSINIKLLSEICEVPGAPGFEQKIREVILREVTPLVDEVSVDNIGNVIAFKKGKKSKKLMMAAHMDEIAFIVHHIDDAGFIRFQPLGGFDPKTLTAQRVIIHGKKDIIGVMGCKPIHIMTAEERAKKLELKDYYIDTGMPKKEVEKIVDIGDAITRERTLIEMGDCVNTKSLDNRVSVFILIEMLRELKKKPAFDIYAVFTVQEEVGLRGAKASALEISPDFAVNIDTTIAFDTPDSRPEEIVTKLGEGTAIKIKDSSVICDRRMVEYMRSQAKKKKIKYQLELLAAGGTDTAALQYNNAGGSIAGALSIPTRHIHQSIEMCHKQDIRDTIDLLRACAEDMDKHDWSFL